MRLLVGSIYICQSKRDRILADSLNNEKNIEYSKLKKPLDFILSFRCTAFSYLDADPELSFFGVYDGHGGTGVANYLKDHLHEFILAQSEYKEGNLEESILKAFLQVKFILK